MPLDALPEELLLRLLSELCARDVCACQRVCRTWRHAAASDYLWKGLTLASHSWLTRALPEKEDSWQSYNEQLSTCASASFVVLGGRVGERLGTGTPRGIGRGRRLGVRSEAWTDMPALDVERRGAALIRNDDGCLYALGGTCERALRSVERLRLDGPVLEHWEHVAPLHTERACPAAAADGRGNIVLTGGGESTYRHATVYSSAEALVGEEWRPFPSMTTARCAHGLALSAGGTLYATGGYGGGTSYLDSIECIDAHAPGERGWQAAGGLDQPRAFGAACVGPDQCLYILGGTDNGSAGLSSCLKWDPRSARRHALAPMSTSRHAFAAGFAPDGSLYVAGGFEWVGVLTSAECYEPRADRWRPLPELEAYMEFCAGVCVW